MLLYFFFFVCFCRKCCHLLFQKVTMLPFIVYICQWINHVYRRSFAGEDWIDTCQPSWPVVHKKWR